MDDVDIFFLRRTHRRMSGTVYEMYSPNCNKTYIGSTKHPLRLRLLGHKYRNHPLFQYGEVNIRPLFTNVPSAELRKKEGECIKERMSDVFNKRVAGRTQKEKYHEDLDASRQYHRSKYTPKKNGGDGQYRQLLRYEKHREEILRQICLRNAVKYKRLPTKLSIQKYNLTDEEIADLKKSIKQAKEDESRTSQD